MPRDLPMGALAALLLTACPGEPLPADAGMDAGAPPADAGPDAGPPPPTSGPGRDSCEIVGLAPADPEPTILFGDLHAHTSTSLDAQLLNLPLFDARPYGPMDACMFARYCSQLDFWSINDHAEEMLPEHWQQNLEAVRDCNDQFDGYTHTPELVTYLGWEWTQSTNDRRTDFGHHNVVLRDTCDAEIPARPFAAPSSFAGIDPGVIRSFRDLIVALDPDNRAVYDAALERVEAVQDKPRCDPEVDTLALPPDCHEIADTPADLYALFERWGLDAIAVPHGTAWGTHHAQRVSWRNRFDPSQLSPRWSPVVEIHSGHGNSEEYRSWRHADLRGDELTCPEPSGGFTACCWRAGEIVRGRTPECATDPEGAACTDAVAGARRDFLAEGKRGFHTVRGAEADDWLECGQCADCFQPDLLLRPERTAQAALAMTRFDDAGGPWRYEFGFVSSTDTHQTGPGAGYKEFLEMTDVSGAAEPRFEPLVQQALSLITPDHTRQESFNYGGGLVAVQTRGRDRRAIWEAIQQRRVYATSGERIELFFDWLPPDGGAARPMGSRVDTDAVPTFRVRARGAFRQLNGCPPSVHEAMGDDFVRTMCFGECYYPTDRRHRIARIEVVKITPQITEGEPLDALIQDPWRTFECTGEGSEDECAVTFVDETYDLDARPASYYVRAIQETTWMVNADTLQCRRDDAGVCYDVTPCDASFAGDCRAPGGERAWSSPIFLYPR